MSVENDKRRYAQLKELVAGNFKEKNSVRKSLNISDAKRHLANLIRKRPLINFEEPKEKIKSKGNK